jgi:hypothetical protein
MKSRDAIERELAQAILSAAQFEQDASGEFMCPSEVLSDLRPAERATVDVTRRACGVNDRIFEQELRHFLFVREIIAGTRKAHRRSA